MNLDRLAVARGAAAGLLISVPGALANVVLADQTPKPKGALNATFLILVLGFTVAGFLAGREAEDRPSLHGVAAAGAAAVLVIIVGILGRLDRGDGFALVPVVLVAVVAAGAGSYGSRIGARRRARILAKENLT